MEGWRERWRDNGDRRENVREGGGKKAPSAIFVWEFMGNFGGKEGLEGGKGGMERWRNYWRETVWRDGGNGGKVEA